MMPPVSLATSEPDPIAMPIREDLWWLSIADSDIKLWAGGIAGARGMDVRVFEPDVSPLAIQGPKSFDVVADSGRINSLVRGETI